MADLLLPGFVRDAWFKAEKVGVYRGQCAELCGKEHGFMPIVVIAKSPGDYAKWVAEEKAKMPKPVVAEAAPQVAAAVHEPVPDREDKNVARPDQAAIEQ